MKWLTWKLIIYLHYNQEIFILTAISTSKINSEFCEGYGARDGSLDGHLSAKLMANYSSVRWCILDLYFHISTDHVNEFDETDNFVLRERSLISCMINVRSDSIQLEIQNCFVDSN